MNEITFSHPSPQIKTDLVVQVKPDQITWAYGLNTANFQTYGGEVVQILSMYVDDLTIAGTVGSYAELEQIYKWFVFYMQVATQGHAGREGYDTRPVTMTYHHRNWVFDIYPKALPAFRYGRDVVAPTWQLQAAVSEFDDKFEDSVLSNQDFAGIAKDGDFDPFGTVTAEIGYNEYNPWSAPTNEKYKPGMAKGEYTKLKDWYGNLIESYIGNDWDSISADYSIPKWWHMDK
jgi:hypothetical protein